MKILFLAANPVDVVTQLRIDREIREIRRKIRMGTLRDHLEIVSEWAVRAGDLQEALLRHQPDIVHFSGHCSQTSGIMLEDEAGNRKVVNRKALRDLFSILKDNIRMVVLNACYARDQAKALATTIDFTIGMNSAIEDKAAIVFSSHFYQSLAFGRSVKESFDLAVNQLELEGIDVAHVPELLVRDGANAARTRIVRPNRRAVEPKSKPAKFRRRKVAVAGARVRPTLIPKNKPNVTISGQAMRGLACEEQEGKLARCFLALAVRQHRNQPDHRCLAPVIYQRRRSAGHSLYDHTIRSYRACDHSRRSRSYIAGAPDQFACRKSRQLRCL